MNEYPENLSSIFKNAFGMHRRNLLKTSLLTVIYLLFLSLASFWVMFVVLNYPLKSVTVGSMLGIFRIAMMFIVMKAPSFTLILVHVLGGLFVALSFIMSIMYHRYIYLNIQATNGKNKETVFMPFSVFISALITDVFLLLVFVAGLVFLLVPSFILTVRYKFVRIALISSEKTGFSKLVEVPNAFASSAKIVNGKNTMSTFLRLAAIFLIRHSALIILAILVFVVSIFVPGILGSSGATSIVVWAVIMLWYVLFMAIGTYMYILLYLGLSNSSHYDDNAAVVVPNNTNNTDSIESIEEDKPGDESNTEAVEQGNDNIDSVDAQAENNKLENAEDNSDSEKPTDVDSNKE